MRKVCYLMIRVKQNGKEYILLMILLCDMGGWQYWTVYYTGTQSFNDHIILFVASKFWILLLNIDYLVSNYKCPNFPTNSFNLQKEVFMFIFIGDIFEFIPLINLRILRYTTDHIFHFQTLHVRLIDILISKW